MQTLNKFYQNLYIGFKHRCRKVKNIGRARFRILGGGGGGQGRPNAQQAHVVLTSCDPRFLINQCQMITFLTVKSNNNIEIEE